MCEPSPSFRPYPRRHLELGFSLIEVLVVVSVLGLLLALSIPAVQASREAARRLTCINNLHEIGIALNAHHGVHGRFPSGMRPDGTSRTGDLYAAGPSSTHAQLLAFIDSGVLFNAINFAGTSFRGPSLSLRPSNETVRKTTVTSFLCPSDGSLSLGGNNYRACVGSLPYMHDGTPWPGGGGAFPGLKAVSAGDFSDGLSITAGFSERLGGSGLKHAFSQPRDLWFSGLEALGNPESASEVASACAGLSTTPPTFYELMGHAWLPAGYENTLYNHVLTPNSRVCDCSTGIYENSVGQTTGGAISARSRHPGVVGVLFMDGSTRFIRESIAAQVWSALGTRSGGETINSTDY
ncbi:prepilin-type N-terminal cleavage/methylation domain-containing protein [Singulisphaera sp. GP187]|uniref:DUF1559 family PulG-like putative transporter n=1 Tax=Singulisphaera sp. GP187 TaxID=1882752 RepID=UPI00092C82F7|nr:prepilin-type N-terminal cleavage/methylation domain-containing protein [Singulisphaera sp. GP187]